MSIHAGKSLRPRALSLCSVSGGSEGQEEETSPDVLFPVLSLGPPPLPTNTPRWERLFFLF